MYTAKELFKVIINSGHYKNSKFKDGFLSTKIMNRFFLVFSVKVFVHTNSLNIELCNVIHWSPDCPD